jgi:hypothetical protein
MIHEWWNFDFVVILCFYRNSQLFEHNHFKFISHYCFHINSSFVLLYYNTTQNMYDIYFLSIDCSTLLLVTSWIPYNAINVTIRDKYKKLNYNKQDWKTLSISYPNVHLSYGILVRKYKNVTITLQKEQENPLKICFVFKPGIKTLSTCLPVGIEIVPPFSTTVQRLASAQAIQKCFRVVQS